jgi:hypothetical protein
MTPADRKKYLKNRQTRTHFAIQAKRTLGRWIPQTGPIEDADKILTSMMHGLINYRAEMDTAQTGHESLLNFAKNPESLLRFCEPSVRHHRRVMHARRIAYRLGLIDERADDAEKHRHRAARFQDQDYLWVTTKDLKFPSGMTITAGSRVEFHGDGEFIFEPTSNHRIRLTFEDALAAKIEPYGSIF